VLRDGIGVEQEMEIPDGSTYVDASEMIPHVQDYTGRPAGMTEVPRLEIRYRWTGRFDPKSGAAIFMPEFLL
jgi:hypothetical protein